MRKKFLITRIAGIQISGTPLALIGSALLWLLFGLLGRLVFQLAPGQSLLGGFLAMVLHWTSDVLHQLGHSFAAHRVGYPMREIRLLHLLAVSIYPRDEPDLPAEIHIRRALGGAPVSIGLAIIGVLAAALLRPQGGLFYLLAMFFFLENLLVFGLGAFLPLGFTDGSTLQEWWPRRGTGVQGSRGAGEGEEIR